MKTVINVLSNWATFIIGTTITFVLSPFVVHTLGDARYGLWGVIGSIVGYLGLLDLGVRVCVTRYVAHHDATGDQTAVNRVITTALGMFAVAGAIAMTLGVVLALLLPRLVDVPPDLVREGELALALAGVTMAAALVGGVFGSSIAGLQRFALLNGIDLSVEVVRAVVVVIVLKTGGGLVGLSLLQLIAVSTRGVLYVMANRRILPGLHITRAGLDRATLRQILRFSSYTMILHISSMIVLSANAIVIAGLMPVAQVTFFVIAANLAQSALWVVGGVTRALYPLLSARQATAGTHGTTGLLAASLRLGTILVLPVVITFLFRGGTFIGLWMGPAYAGPSGAVLRILAVGLCVFVGFQMFTSNIMALDLHRGLAPASVMEAVSNVGISLGLGSVIGLNGVAWGTTLPRLVVAVAFAPWFAGRHLALRFRQYALHAWVRPFAAMIPFAVASALVNQFWQAPNLLVFFGQVALLLPLAGAGAWVIGLEDGERTLVLSWVRRRLAKRVVVPDSVGHA